MLERRWPNQKRHYQHCRATHKFQVGDLVLLKKHNADKMGLRWEFNIEQHFTSPYTPRSNGTMVNFNKFLKASMRELCQEDTAAWDQGLDQILFMFMYYRVIRLKSPWSAMVENQISGKTKCCNVGDLKPKHPSEDWTLKPSSIGRAAWFINHPIYLM